MMLMMTMTTAMSDEQTVTLKLSLKRERVERLIAMLEVKRNNGGLSDQEKKAYEVATLRLYGAGASPKKFARLAAQQVDGVLRGQYRFAGAAQTGRMSSRGAQIQNLARDVLGEGGAAEAALVDAIADGCSYTELTAAEPVDVPVARKLALLVRPALIAGSGKVFVWSDWSAIEARITPWLANLEGAEAVLDIYRANDRDPSLPDIYTIAAANILHKDTNAITKPERQIGKVATLSLQFLGSVGALTAMALSYRVHLDGAEARRIVDIWREANPWAIEFGNALWDAAMTAWELPGQITTAGRLAFVYREDYLGGALFMALPSGRLLTYPQPHWRDVDVLDKVGKPTGEKRTELSFRRAHGRAKLWKGTLAENSTQAVAADFLRQTVTRIETNPGLAFMPIRMTTHDEIVCEVDETRAEEAKAILRREMLTLPDWAEGLPLNSEENSCAWYTKSKAALGGKS
jgi:DNA polymerase